MANEYTYRADHIGSLVVPGALAEARKQFASGAIDLDRLQNAENAAIKSAVDMQRSAGMAVMTDGAFRRSNQVAAKLEGDTLAKGEVASLRATSRRPIKVTVPAARPIQGEGRDSVLARAAIVRKEIEALIAAGVDYVQLDAPDYALSFDPAGAVAIDDLLAFDAAAVSGIERPAHVRIGMHVMRPDNAVLRRSADTQAAEQLFRAVAVDRFLFPLDDAGADFDLLRLAPKGQLVVLGLLSATNAALEDVDDLMSRIDRAAKLIDGDHLALSPATGFGGGISEADERRKLELITDVATRWWGFAM